MPSAAAAAAAAAAAVSRKLETRQQTLFSTGFPSQAFISLYGSAQSPLVAVPRGGYFRLFIPSRAASSRAAARLCLFSSPRPLNRLDVQISPAASQNACLVRPASHPLTIDTHPLSRSSSSTSRPRAAPDNLPSARIRRKTPPPARSQQRYSPRIPPWLLIRQAAS